MEEFNLYLILGLLLIALNPNVSYSEELVENKFYAGIAYGNVDLTSNDKSQNQDALSLSFGYQPVDWLSFESNYLTAINLKPDINHLFGIDLSAKFNAQLVTDLQLFTRIGASYIDYQTRYNTHGGVSPLIAIGAEYQLSEKWSLRTEHIWINDISDNSAPFPLFNIGVTYQWGSGSNNYLSTELDGEQELDDEQKPTGDVSESILPMPAQVSTQLPELVVYQFGFDSDSIETPLALNELLLYLSDHQAEQVEVIGHTDSVGTEKYNQILSERRAQAVSEQLLENGIEKSRILVLGQGELSPVADNATSQGREKNRRVEIKVSQ